MSSVPPRLSTRAWSSGVAGTGKIVIRFPASSGRLVRKSAPGDTLCGLTLTVRYARSSLGTNDDPTTAACGTSGKCSRINASGSAMISV